MRAVLKKQIKDVVINISLEFQNCWPKDFPEKEDRNEEFLKNVNDKKATPEQPMPDASKMGAREFEVAMKAYIKYGEKVKKRHEVSTGQ